MLSCVVCVLCARCVCYAIVVCFVCWCSVLQPNCCVVCRGVAVGVLRCVFMFVCVGGLCVVCVCL